MSPSPAPTGSRAPTAANSDTLRTHIDQGSGAITSYGVGALIWGVLALLVGFALWRGANWGRIVIAVLELAHVAGGVYLLFAWDGHYLWQGIWQIVVAAFVFWLLFNPRADEFFTGARTA